MRYWILLGSVIVISGVFSEFLPRIVGDSTLAVVLTLVGSGLFLSVLVLREVRIYKRQKDQ